MLGSLALILLFASSPDDGVRLAYVDPGAGSFVLQALVATLAGAAVAVNAYWKRIRRFLGLGKADDDQETKGPEPSDE